MRRPHLLTAGLLLFAPAIVLADPPVALGVQTRYGHETHLGLGVRAAAPFTVQTRTFQGSIAMDRYLSSALSYSEISLSVVTDVARTSRATFYAGGGPCGGHVRVKGPGREPVYDPPRTISRWRQEWAIQATGGVRLPRGLFAEARVATSGVERGLLTVGLLF